MPGIKTLPLFSYWS